MWRRAQQSLAAKLQALQNAPPQPRLPKLHAELEISMLSVKIARHDRGCHLSHASAIGDDGFAHARGCVCDCEHSTETWQNVTWIWNWSGSTAGGDGAP